MIRTDKLFMDGGVVGIRSADGAIHTASGASLRDGSGGKAYERCFGRDDASVCLNCTRKHCVGTEECYKEERRRQQQTGETEKDPGRELFELFMKTEYARMKGEGMSDRQISLSVGLTPTSLFNAKRQERFTAKGCEKVKKHMREVGIKFGE